MGAALLPTRCWLLRPSSLTTPLLVGVDRCLPPRIPSRVRSWNCLPFPSLPFPSLLDAAERGATRWHDCGCLAHTRAAPLRRGATAQPVWSLSDLRCCQCVAEYLSCHMSSVVVQGCDVPLPCAQ